MSKKILSWILACALIITCFGGMALFTTAETAYPNVEITVYDAEPDLAYIRVFGNALANSRHHNRLVYIKIQASEGFENATFVLQNYEVSVNGNESFWSIEQGIAQPKINMVNGEGGLFLSASFNNSLNNLGSLRATVGEMAKISSMMVYDVATYCTEANADAALVAQFHQAMQTENYNLKTVGYQAPTTESEGATGSVECATCGHVFSANSTLPKLVNYAQVDLSTGEIQKVNMASYKTDDGISLDPVKIPGTDAYGLKLSQHNKSFRLRVEPGTLGDLTVDAIDNGKKIAISVEYYLPANADNATRLMFDGWAGQNKWVALYSNYSGKTLDAAVLNPTTPLTRGSLSVATFIVGKDVNYVTGPGQFGAGNEFSENKSVNTYDLAKKFIEGTGSVNIYPWSVSEDAPIYIKSITIYDANALASAEDPESDHDYIDYTTKYAHSPVFYPQYRDSVGRYSGLVATEVAEGSSVYVYYAVSKTLLKEGEEKTPVVVRFTFKENSNLTAFQWSYQALKHDGQNGGEVWKHVSTEITGRVVDVALPDAVFENQLNQLGSIRITNDKTGYVRNNLAKVEVLPLADKTALQAAVDEAEKLTEGKTSSSVAAFTVVLNAAKAILEQNFVTEQDVQQAIADLKAAESLLADCPHDGDRELIGYVEETCLTPGYTGDSVCADCGFLPEDGKGEEIPPHETSTRNEKEATCTEPSYSGDLWCEVCQKIVRGGIYGATIDHTWDEGAITKPATPNERGEITTTCTACGATEKSYFDYEVTVTFGDVNGDDKIDSTDARLVLQYAVGKIDDTAITTAVADVDGNGKVDSTDARLILQYTVGKFTHFSENF